MKKEKSPLAINAKRRIERRRADRFSQIRHQPQDLPRNVVYNDLPAISINPAAIPTMETRRQADSLFDSEIKQATTFKSSKIDDKKVHFQQVLHAVKQAIYHGGAILFPRNYAHPDFSKIRKQVLECAIEKGLFWPQYSPPGSPKMSRLLPMPKLREYAEIDPWKIAPDRKSVV